MTTTTNMIVWPSDQTIADLTAAGLTVPCILRLRLTSIPNELILRHIGQLSAVDRLACERVFAEMILG